MWLHARRPASVHNIHGETSKRVKIDEERITQRLKQLSQQRSSSRYAKQKSALEKELFGFLSSLSTSKSLASTLPSDVIAFLVWKDHTGKTRVHLPGCPSPVQAKGLGSICNCPKLLAFGTVDSLIGKLRAIFMAHSRGTEWQSLLGVGNPAACRTVKNYLADVRAEQLKATVVPCQAEPALLVDLEVISRHIQSKLMHCSALSPAQIFIAARDQAIFKTLFFCGGSSC